MNTEEGNDILAINNNVQGPQDNNKRRNNRIYILFSIIGIVLISAVLLALKLDVVTLMRQKTYSETSLSNTRIIVVLSGDKNFDNLNYPSSSDLKLISFDDKGVKSEEIIDSLAGSGKQFVDGTVIAEKVVYAIQSATAYELFLYDIGSKEKKAIDQIDASSPVGTGNSRSNFEGKVAVKFMTSPTVKKMFFYHNGALKIYDLDNGSKTEIKLWEKVTDSDWDKGPVRNIKLKPDSGENIATSNYDIFEDPNDVIYQNGQLNFLFSNLYLEGADSSLENICGKNYSGLGDDWISSSASSIKCGVDSDYGCEVFCPPKNVYLGLNKYNDNYFTEFNDLAEKDPQAYVLTRTKALLDINCGGYFQIGPCISNHVDTIAVLDEKGEKEKFEHYGYMNYHGQRINNLTLSSEKNLVAYSLLDDLKKDVYVLDLSSNAQPLLVAAKSFPLFIGIDNQNSNNANLTFPKFHPSAKDAEDTSAEATKQAASSQELQGSPGIFDDDYLHIVYDPGTFFPKKSDFAPSGDIIRSYDVIPYAKPNLEDYIFKNMFITFYKNNSGMNNEEFLKNITPNPNDPNAFTDQLERKKLGNKEYVKSRTDKGKAMYYENLTKNYDLRIQCNAPEGRLFTESDISKIESFISSITYKQ